MIRRPPRSTRTDTLLPDTTRVRSRPGRPRTAPSAAAAGALGAAAQPACAIDPAGCRPARHPVPATARPPAGLAARAQEKLEYLVVSPRLTVRSTNPDARRILEAAGIHPLLARLWAAPGVNIGSRSGWDIGVQSDVAQVVAGSL